MCTLPFSLAKQTTECRVNFRDERIAQLAASKQKSLFARDPQDPQGRETAEIQHLADTLDDEDDIAVRYYPHNF